MVVVVVVVVVVVIFGSLFQITAAVAVAAGL